MGKLQTAITLIQMHDLTIPASNSKFLSILHDHIKKFLKCSQFLHEIAAATSHICMYRSRNGVDVGHWV